MKRNRTRYLWIVVFLVAGYACQKKSEPGTGNETTNGKASADSVINYEQEMRNFIQGISAFAKQQRPGFLIVPQDGLTMLTNTGDSAGMPVAAYLAAIDGVGQEEVYYGYDNNDDATTPASARNAYLRLLHVAQNNGKMPLVTDYCTTASKITNSYANNAANRFISYAATHRELDNIATTTPYNVNASNITSLDSAKNFLYFIDPSGYSSKTTFLNDLKATNFDVLILDFSFNDDASPLTAADVQSLKTKANGGKRIVLAYMSIGQAEDYRWYWNSSWLTSPPAWLLTSEDPDWEGDYPVRYWMSDWKSIIYGSNSSYTQKLLNAGFDGAYLDTYNYQYWEAGN